MLPIAINVAKLQIALVGDSKSVARRLALLDQAGAGDNIKVFSQAPCKPLVKIANDRLIKRWPTADELQDCAIVLGADLEEEQERLLAEMARKSKALLNIEDRRQYCDFYYASIIRRGDLVFSVNTNGKSPALAMRMRKKLKELFPPIWAKRLDELAQLRQAWKKEGASFKEVLEKSNVKIDEYFKD